MRSARFVSAAALLSLVLAGPGLAQQPSQSPSPAPDGVPSLGSYRIDGSAISVSGISSGAFMAVQYHVAHSARVMGAGVVAGGPYYCAQDSALTAITTCMGGMPPPGPETLQLVTNALASGGDIDPTDNLRGDRVYLFSGTQDTVVATPVMQALETYYEGYIDAGDIVFVDDIDAPHSFVTNFGENESGEETRLSESPQSCFPECPDMMSCFHVCLGTEAACEPNPCLADNHCTFVNNCDYDTARHIFSHIYGADALQPAGRASRDNLVAFEQSEFADNPRHIGMGETGYLYVPSECQTGDTACRLHIAFHGCLQGANRIGDAFYWGAGYNRWAESNNIVVLYPQAVGNSSLQLYNPMGCWDWWGFTGPFYARQEGRQIRTINAMVSRLVGNDGSGG
jgi:poly(3-hydroxybutyrate) depolymerase